MKGKLTDFLQKARTPEPTPLTEETPRELPQLEETTSGWGAGGYGHVPGARSGSHPRNPRPLRLYAEGGIEKERFTERLEAVKRRAEARLPELAKKVFGPSAIWPPKAVEVWTPKG